jgi:hypothetical protein
MTVSYSKDDRTPQRRAMRNKLKKAECLRSFLNVYDAHKSLQSTDLAIPIISRVRDSMIVDILSIHSAKILWDYRLQKVDDLTNEKLRMTFRGGMLSRNGAKTKQK